MANPIPTQNSPGVNVSEVDLSTFVQPIVGNVGGMAGVFNWGPCLIANSISSDSELAEIYGKPTIDGADSSNDDDFLAASNFLRYSNNFKVVRILQSEDYNAVSKDTGVGASINSGVVYKTIRNEDQFRLLGGFSGNAGIETISHFKARYPGKYGNSLKVVVYDNPTQTQYRDFEIAGGSAVNGIVSGTIGFTFGASTVDNSNPANPIFGSTGPFASTFTYYKITLNVPNGENAGQFISNLSNRFNFYYAATGTTTENYSLTQDATNPSGNYSKYYALKEWNTDTVFNPFRFGGDQQYAPKYVLAKPNLTNPSSQVDVMFIDMDYTNSNANIRIGATVGSANNYITGYTGQQVHNIPSNFNNLSAYFGGEAFDAWRFNWSKIDTVISGQTSSSGPRGWAMLVGLTGSRTYSNGSDGSTIGVTFDAVGGLVGIQRDFKFGMKQIGYNSTISSSENRESFTDVRIFGQLPTTSQYASDRGGSNDEISIAIIDTGGKFGPKNSVLEKFELLSKATDAKNSDGESIYYKDYINNNSRYVYLTRSLEFTGGGSNSSTSETTFGDIFSKVSAADGLTYTRTGYYESQLVYGGSTTANPTVAEKTLAYEIFADDDSAVDILFVPESSVPNDVSSDQTTLENSIYDKVIDVRKDTLFIVPTPKPASITQHSAQAASNAITFRKNLLGIPSNSYTILVAGRKLYFDGYNNQIRKMSLSSDIAGIMSAQEIPWESPAGFARGNLKNVIRLETAFTKQDRDNLYKNQINFFNQFTDGSGTVLFGDKTLLVKPSAFDRINVRRTFTAIEKSIARAAKYSLFEFNDEFTRSQFRNLVNPFLRNFVSQRGIAEYRVVCDETNNTTEVIDNNQFVADIYIKPLKSINFIQLNFIAVRNDFSFTVVE